MKLKPFVTNIAPLDITPGCDPAETLSRLITEGAVGFAGGFAAPDTLFADRHPIALQWAGEFLEQIGMKQIGTDPDYGRIYGRDHRSNVYEFFDAQEQREKELTGETDDAQAA